VSVAVGAGVSVAVGAGVSVAVGSGVLVGGGSDGGVAVGVSVGVFGSVGSGGGVLVGVSDGGGVSAAGAVGVFVGGAKVFVGVGEGAKIIRVGVGVGTSIGGFVAPGVGVCVNGVPKIAVGVVTGVGVAGPVGVGLLPGASVITAVGVAGAGDGVGVGNNGTTVIPGAGVPDDVGVAKEGLVAVAKPGWLAGVAVGSKEFCARLVSVGLMVDVGVGALAPGGPLGVSVAATPLGAGDVIELGVPTAPDVSSIASIVSTISASETSSPSGAKPVVLVGAGRGAEGLMPSASPTGGIGVAAGSTTVIAGATGVSPSSDVDNSSPVSVGPGSSFCTVSIAPWLLEDCCWPGAMMRSRNPGLSRTTITKRAIVAATMAREGANAKRPCIMRMKRSQKPSRS
jgi:hypothetical protein